MCHIGPQEVLALGWKELLCCLQRWRVYRWPHIKGPFSEESKLTLGGIELQHPNIHSLLQSDMTLTAHCTSLIACSRDTLHANTVTSSANSEMTSCLAEIGSSCISLSTTLLKTPFLGKNFCANEFAASKNPNHTMIWGNSIQAIFYKKGPKMA